MKNLKVVYGLVIGSCLIALAGCATKQQSTTGDYMSQHAADAQSQVDLQNQLAKDWRNGEKLVATGEKRVLDGEKEVERGRREIAEGKTLMLESKNRFRENFPEMDIELGR